MRVLVVDDHQLVIDALEKYLIGIDPDVEVIPALKFEETIDNVRESPDFDLIILDLYLPDMTGLEGLTLLHSQCPDIPIVMISGVANRREIMDALERGAAGFIPKGLSSAMIVKALEIVLSGERYIPSILVGGRSLIEKELGYSGQVTRDTGSPFGKLTRREREVLALLLNGYSNKEIARNIGVKEITAAFHLRGVFKKLGVSNRTKAAAKALREGWQPPDVS